MVEVETGNCHQLVGWIKWNQKYARERGAQGSLPSLAAINHSPPLSVTQESLLTQWSIILSQIKPRVDCKAQHQHQQLPAAGWEYLLCGELDGPIVLTTIVLPLLPVIDLMNAGQIREQKDMLNLGKLWRWRRLLIFLCLFIIAELRYHTHSNLSSLV